MLSHQQSRLFVVLIVSIVSLSSCKIGRFVWYNFADIKDYKIFPNRNLQAAVSPSKFREKAEMLTLKGTNSINGKNVQLEEYLAKNKTVAFLIIRNDSLVYEKYFNNYKQTSIVPSFSMAKSFTSALIGCAIHDGYIASVEQPVTDFIPELKPNGFEHVTIKHLLQMTSGLKFNENYYNPFGDAATFYYGRNLRKAISKLKLANKPGEQFNYTSGSSQLLGLVLERALKGKKITDYLSQKVWGPLEMEYPASWSLDKKKNGLEKTFCCINARARDFAKFGQLYLHQGEWNGQQLIPEDWVKESTKVDTTAGSSWHYQYQWWIDNYAGTAYYAEGFLGQFIYVDTAKHIVIVRLGKDYGHVNWPYLFRSLSSTL